MQIENNVKIAGCMQKECNKIAVFRLWINKKSFCLCKNCLSRFYDCIGSVLVPKSPLNFLNDEKAQRPE